jgi:phage repressor protein C with HTH and peptisase S24 domain
MSREKSDTIADRIRQIVESKGLSINKFSASIGASNSYFSKVFKSKVSVGSDRIEKILRVYEDIRPEWLILGEGNMHRSKENIVEENSSNYFVSKTERSAPYYNYPVQAGTETEIFLNDMDPSGHIEIPGVRAIAFFPVIGFSMEPTIRNGDIIGIDEIDSWERMDPDKIYYIITDSDRMIKHLAIHKSDDEVLICLSPNYKEFFIRKENVKAIYRVVFYGRIA